MTTKEFKELCPDKAHLTGDSLWNAMEDYMLSHPELERKEEPLNTTKPLHSYRFIILDFSESNEESNIKHIED